MTVHFSSDGKVTLCGYQPAESWAADHDKWADDETKVSCPTCSAVLNAEGGA